MMPGFEIAMAILRACGIDPDDVCAVTFRSSVEELTMLDVTYVLMKDNKIDMPTKRYRIVEELDGAA